jgi:hypothetical protein
MVKANSPDEVYDTIRSAFYNILVIEMFRNLVDNMGEPGQKYLESVFAMFKSEMRRQAEREAKAVAEEVKEITGEDFDMEAYMAKVDPMVDEIIMEFRDIFRKRA